MQTAKLSFVIASDKLNKWLGFCKETKRDDIVSVFAAWKQNVTNFLEVNFKRAISLNHRHTHTRALEIETKHSMFQSESFLINFLRKFPNGIRKFSWRNQFSFFLTRYRTIRCDPAIIYQCREVSFWCLRHLNLSYTLHHTGEGFSVADRPSYGCPRCASCKDCFRTLDCRRHFRRTAENSN